MAVAAAFDDPRFPPLKAEELKDLELSNCNQLKNINEGSLVIIK